MLYFRILLIFIFPIHCFAFALQLGTGGFTPHFTSQKKIIVINGIIQGLLPIKLTIFELLGISGV